MHVNAQDCRPETVPSTCSGSIPDGRSQFAVNIGENVCVNSDVTISGSLSVYGGVLWVSNGAKITLGGGLFMSGGIIILTL